MPTNADLGVALRRLRRARKRTIEDVAFAADVHPTYLSGIERGVRNPTWAKLCALAAALSVLIASLAQCAESEAYVAHRVREARCELDAQADRGGEVAEIERDVCRSRARPSVASELLGRFRVPTVINKYEDPKSAQNRARSAGTGRGRAVRVACRAGGAHGRELGDGRSAGRGGDALGDVGSSHPPVNVLKLPSEDVAIALGHTDGGELVRKLYGHRDQERALDRVTAAYERTASFTQMRLV